MLQGWALFLVSAAYVALLFAIAYYGDRRVSRGQPPARKPWIYSLTLGVYCTSWTFYGAVGRAVESGWDFLPIYLGPMLVFGLGYKLVRASSRSASATTSPPSPTSSARATAATSSSACWWR